MFFIHVPKEITLQINSADIFDKIERMFVKLCNSKIIF